MLWGKVTVQEKLLLEGLEMLQDWRQATLPAPFHLQINFTCSALRHSRADTQQMLTSETSWLQARADQPHPQESLKTMTTSSRASLILLPKTKQRQTLQRRLLYLPTWTASWSPWTAGLQHSQGHELWRLGRSATRSL